MRLDWRLPDGELFAAREFAQLEVLEALVEDPELQIAVWKTASSVFLGVACDDDADGLLVRWLFADIDHVERDALILGALAVRDAILKPEVRVVDIQHGEVVRAWAIHGSSIPKSALPTRGALLPKRSRWHAAPALSMDSGVVRVGGGGVGPDHRIRFDDLSAVLSTEQRLFTAVAQALSDGDGKDRGKVKNAIAERAVLYADASGPGSYLVTVAPADAETFAHVVDTVRGISLASDDPERLVPALTKLRRRVTSAYVAFLQSLAKRKLNVLVQWQNHVAFMGYGSARRVADAVESIGKVFEEEFVVRGYVTAYDQTENTFTLVEAGTPERYEGFFLPGEFPREIRVGQETLYDAKITAWVVSDVHGTTREMNQLTRLEQVVEEDPQDADR